MQTTVSTPTRSPAGTATLSRTQGERLVRAAQRDPVWFCEHVLGAKLWPKQQAIARAVWTHRRTVVRACRRSGKSHVAGRIALAYLFSWPRSVVLTTAPGFRQVGKVIWEEIHAAYGQARVPLGGTLLQTELHVAPGWFALGLTSDKPDRFQGINIGERTLVIVDEASGLDPHIWQAIEGILASEHTRLLMLGNPTEVSGAFRAEFDQPATAKFRISAFDTPNFTEGRVVYSRLITPTWVEERRRVWGENSILWAAHVEGEFPDSAVDSLIPLSWVERARERDGTTDGPNVLGVDVAWQGDDATVIVHRRGTVARIYAVHRQEDPMQTAGRIVQARRDTGAETIYVDAIGLGAGVVARLQELQEPVVGVNVAERAYDSEQYANRRSECFFGLRARFQDSDIALVGDPMHLDMLAADLTSIRVPPPNSRGQIRLEPKEETKRRIQRSPDMADALMLACCGASALAFDPQAIVAYG
jgi:phage terminase large subunit